MALKAPRIFRRLKWAAGGDGNALVVVAGHVHPGQPCRFDSQYGYFKVADQLYLLRCACGTLRLSTTFNPKRRS